MSKRFHFLTSTGDLGNERMPPKLSGTPVPLYFLSSTRVR
jgi:hypothetical protein